MKNEDEFGDQHPSENQEDLFSQRPKRRTSIKAARQLVDIRSEFRRTRQQIYRRASLIVFTLVVGFTFTTYEVTSSISKKEREAKRMVNKIRLSEQIKIYDLHLNTGAEQIKQQQWDSAVNQFKRALLVAPEDLVASEGLAEAYCLKCMDSNANCDQAMASIVQLEELSPKHPRAKVLRSFLNLKKKN